MRKTTILVVMVLALLAAAVAPAGAVAPSPAAYLSFGDAVAAGEGATSEATGFVSVVHRDARSVDCREGSSSACPRLELHNEAVGGATSTDVLLHQLPGVVDEIAVRNNDADPDNDVEMITVVVGGNDVFQPVLAACQGGVNQTCIDTINATFGTYATNLGVILGSLRAAAGPDTYIGVMTYYNSLVACDLASLAPLGDLVLEGGEGLPVGLNDIIRGTAAATQVTAVETYGLLGPEDLVGGEDCLHPDNSGHRLIAEAFTAARP